MPPSDRERPRHEPPYLPGQPALASASGAPARSGGGALKGGVVALLLAILAKGKGLLLLVKGLPFLKLLVTFGSMGASMWLYATRGGWAFAFVFVLMIFIHEMGHALALKRAGVEAGWPVFIPFFGAMISMKGQPSHPCVEADVAYAGPVAGTAAALGCAGLGLALHSPFFLSLAYTGFFLNLFNLTPIGFLDGGRVARVLSRKASIFGAVVMAGLCWLSPSPQLILIAVMAVVHSMKRDDSDLQLVTNEDRRTWAIRYFGLCGFLGLGLLLTQQLTKSHGW